MIVFEWDAQKKTLENVRIHLYAFLFYRRLSTQFQFSLSAFTLWYLSLRLGLAYLGCVACWLGRDSSWSAAAAAAWVWPSWAACPPAAPRTPGSRPEIRKQTNVGDP